MKQLCKFSLGFLIAGLCAGCASMPSSMITSTSPLPPGVRGTIKTSASDCQYSLLGIIPFTSSASTASALEDAKSYADVDVLTDVTQDFSSGYYILWSNTCVRVSGYGVPRDVLKKHLDRQNQ
ncbi:MAG: hypothetical protein J0M12_17780 [Deltaproteobacteria bacterium]|nr:hypothetical protein [Deltaproteobacteria bacterium]